MQQENDKEQDDIEEYINTEYKDLDVLDLFMLIRDIVTLENAAELIRNVESEYIDQADTELGDFLNSVAEILLLDSVEKQEFSLYQLIIKSELNLDMLKLVGTKILELHYESSNM